MGKPLGIEWFKEYALRRGGRCLSDDYRSVKSRLRFRCRNNHEWGTSGHSARYGSWCPQCHHVRIAHLQRDSHGFYAALAKDRGGQLLSGTYENSNTRMQFQCSNGHAFEYRAAKIKRGQWCPKCASVKRGIERRDSIELFQELAKSKGGVCHTATYTDQNALLEMECARGHRWDAPAKRVKRGDWCAKCAGNEKRDIQEFRDLVEARGGKLLSTHYKGAHMPLRIECNRGHQFTISFPNARSGKWCPYCKTRIGESMCRLAFETIFRERFPISHPKWLANPKTRKPLQLDGYCERLKLAFEHQGQQHNKAVDRFGGQDGFRSLQLRDRFKSEKCKEHGVLLVCIDELFTTIQPTEIRSEIIRACKENGFSLPSDVDLVPIDFSKVYKLNIKEQYVAEVKDFLTKNHEGSVLLTDEIVRCNSGVSVRCPFIKQRILAKRLGLSCREMVQRHRSARSAARRLRRTAAGKPPPLRRSRSPPLGPALSRTLVPGIRRPAH